MTSPYMVIFELHDLEGYKQSPSEMGFQVHFFTKIPNRGAAVQIVPGKTSATTNCIC
jgi:hypothetical protein